MLSERQTLLSEGIGSSQSRSELMEGWRHAAREYGLDQVTLSVAPTAQDRHVGRLLELELHERAGWGLHSQVSAPR